MRASVFTRSPRKDPWICWSPCGSKRRVRLVCFSYAGGGPTVYRSWTTWLPESVELWGILLPGRGARLREPPLHMVADMVEEVAEALARHGDAPLALFGHSLGALVAFETARALRRQPAPPVVQLFVSAARAPQRRPTGRPIAQLTDQDLIRMLRQWNGTPSSVLRDPGLVDAFLPAIRADISALETYEYLDDRPLACPITALGGDRDPLVTIQALDEWRVQTEGVFKKRVVMGDHFFLQSNGASFRSAMLEELVALRRTLGGKVTMRVS